VDEQVIERFIERGNPHRGFACIYCDACGPLARFNSQLGRSLN
jgi:hypothetical protein